MILYLDSSSLVKIYLEEAESDLVREWAGAAEEVATSQVAYPEALSAFTRCRERGGINSDMFHRIQETFANDWGRFVSVPVEERRAGSLAVKHVLRGFDAVHLAAAIQLRELIPGDSVVFSAFDTRLLRAARAEGMPVLLPREEDAG